MKNVKSALKNKGGITIAILSAMALIILAGAVSKTKVCNEIIVHISNNLDNHFIVEEDIVNLVTNHGEHKIINKPMTDINLKEIEKNLMSEKFIKMAHTYKNLEGKLIIDAELRRPLARIIRERAPNAYLSFDKNILPVSDRFSSRTILISGHLADSLMNAQTYQTPYGEKLFEFLIYINNDPFWKAQIAQMDIDKKGEIVLYPQVTVQLVDFGKPDNYQKKLKKLKMFYVDVLPRKGWSNYERINLKFDNQIIAN